MNVALAVLLAMLAILLLLIRSVRVKRASLSDFELSRRAKLRDPEAIRQSRREKAAPVLLSFQRIISLLLLFGLVWCAIALFGVGWGIALGVILCIWGAWGESIPLFKKVALYFYEPLELRLIPFVLRHKRFFGLFPKQHPTKHEPSMGSRDEFLDLLTHRTPFFDANERSLVLGALELSSQSVKQVMTKKAHVTSVKTNEILGPLVLDELYKTGEKSFVVVSGDIDHPVGILYLDRLTNLLEHRTPNALSAMEPHIETIDHDASLEQAMSILLETKLPLLVVVDEERTVGIISLEMIVSNLIRKD